MTTIEYHRRYVAPLERLRRKLHDWQPPEDSQGRAEREAEIGALEHAIDQLRHRR